MFNKKSVSILTVALIVGVLGIAGIAMAAPNTTGMPCFDPAVRQQMVDSHVKSGFMSQEQADQMNNYMNQMMNGGQSNPMMQQGPNTTMPNGQSNPMMNGGMMNPASPTGPQGNTTTPGK